jgi:endo-1,4-beta-xylanase
MNNRYALGRRAVLAGMAAGGANAMTSRLGFAQSVAYSPDTEPLQLNKLAAARGLVFGSPFLPFQFSKSNDPNVWLTTPYGKLFKHQCGIATILDDWNYTEPVQGKLATYPYLDSVVNLLFSQGMKIRMGDLAWAGDRVPAWFEALPNRNAGIDALHKRIFNAMAHRAGKVWTWDVVNEALKPDDGLDGALRNSALVKVIGMDWMRFAFSIARQIDPKAMLVYNDYNMEFTKWGESDAKRAGMLKLLDDFQKNKIPIDGIGFQSHMFADRWQYFDAASFKAFLDQISSRGLKILITELDVIDVSLPADPSARDMQIAAFYKKFLDTVLSNKSVVMVETWGLSDEVSWQLQETNKKNPDKHFARADGFQPRPLPFDIVHKPKPAAYAMAEAFKNAPSRA